MHCHHSTRLTVPRLAAQAAIAGGLLATWPAAPARAQGATITVEIATEHGVQATAHRDWLQLLTDAGASDVRIRGERPGDRPQLTESNTTSRPSYRLVGLLDHRGQLTLPGGRFTLRSRSQLKDYFDRLAADGAEGVTAERGAYGLTRQQIETVTKDLARPLATTTKGKSLADVLHAANKVLRQELRVDGAAWQVIRRSDPVTDEVKDLTVGTALALLLKRDGLVLLPVKPRGEEVAYRVARRADFDGETWPVGWKSEEPTSRLAPDMMQRLNVEVAGFTLAEAIDAMAPRTGVPIYWDHQVLAERQIDPATIDVKLPRQRTPLVRAIDRLLFQARLRGELRVDEAGTAFYWISR